MDSRHRATGSSGNLHRGSGSTPCCSQAGSRVPDGLAGALTAYCGHGRGCGDRCEGVILPKVRDPRFVTIRRGGVLTDADHQLLALWAAACAEHVLDFFESAQPDDPRPRHAIEHARAWVHGEVKMTEA